MSLGARLLEGLPRRPIVLHFDLNRTIIQVDLAGGKTLKDILNNNLASCVHGISTALPTSPVAERDKPIWRPCTDPDGKRLEKPPASFSSSAVASVNNHSNSGGRSASFPPFFFTKEQIDAAEKSKHLMTYDEFVDEVVAPKPKEMDSLPKEEALKLWGTVTAKRRALKNTFTDAGQPGEIFSNPFFTEMEQRMLKPKTASSRPGETHFVIPAFFVMVETLWELRWPFRIVFRTFGHELKLVLDDVEKILSERAPGMWGYVMRNAAEAQIVREREKASALAQRTSTSNKSSSVSSTTTTTTMMAAPPHEDTHGPYLWCAVSSLYRDAVNGSVLCHGVDASPKSLDDWKKSGRSFAPTNVRELYIEFTGRANEEADFRKRQQQIMAQQQQQQGGGGGEEKSIGGGGGLSSVVPIAFRGFVDCYPWWAANGERDTAGKVFPVKTTPFADELDPLQVFFDDNMFAGDEHSIIDLRDIGTGQNLSKLEVQNAFCVRVEPRFAILDEFYFVRKFAQAAMEQVKLRTASPAPTVSASAASAAAKTGEESEEL